VFYMVSADAAGWAKRGGPNVRICDFSGDDVQFQELVDLAQALGTNGDAAPKICFYGGRYDFNGPVYIGYSGTTPSQNFGVDLEMLGNVTFTNSGGGANDEGKFMLYIAPRDGGTGTRSLRGPIEISALNMAGGIYWKGVHNGVMENVKVNYGTVAGIWVEDGWLSSFNSVRAAYQDGIGIGFNVANATSVRRLGVAFLDSTALAGGAVGGLKRYTVDNESGTGWVEGEEVNITDANGAERGVLLSRESATSYIIGHGTRAAFVNNDTIYGTVSGETADVDVTIEDLGCALYLSGTALSVDCANIEENTLADDDTGANLPLVLASNTATTYTGGLTLQNFRFEGATSSSQYRRQAETYFRFINTPNLVMDYIQAQNNVYSLRDTAVTVTDNGATGTITNCDAISLAEFADDGTDTVYLYDGSGGITDGSYTVTSGSVDDVANSFDITTDPGTTASARCFATTYAVRLQPVTAVDLQNCDNASIRNLQAHGFSTSLVKIDAACTNVRVENVFDSAALWFDNSEDNFLYGGVHPDILDDSGVGTKLVNPFIPNYTGLIYAARTGVEVITETNDGTSNKTTLLLKDQTVVLADQAGVVAYGGQKVFDFPEGAILVEGVTSDLDITKSSAGVNDDWDGDYGIGSVTASNDATLSGTEQDMLPTTLTPQAVGGATTADGQSTSTENAVIDGTGTAVDAFLNFLVDDADHDVGGTACNLIVNGRIVIHWKNLGDY
jgi:hypothetical protein